MPRTHAPHHQLLFLIITALVMGGAFGVAFLLKQSESLSRTDAPDTAMQQVSEAVARGRLAENASYAVGPANAKVVLVGFIDFQCPFSKAVAPTIDQLMKEYEGKPVRFVFRNFPISPIHPGAIPAAHASLCAADQGRYKEMYDILYASQDAIDNLFIAQAAQRLDLNLAQFNSCFGSKKHQVRIMRDIADGTSLGITGTPTFYLNGAPIIGARPIETFRTALDKALAQ